MLGFDSNFLLLKNSDGIPKGNLKIIYQMGNEEKRVVSKILTMDKNTLH